MKLAEPVKIGQIKTKNRICIPPMVLYGHAGADGRVTEAHIAHYARLAKGGAGLIIQEATCILLGGRLRQDQLGIWEDAQTPGLKKLVEAVHREDCPIFIQLHHGAAKDLAALDVEKIEHAFVEAGRRAFLAGYDGVELHGCHSYLLCQLLNGETNDAGVDGMGLISRIIARIRASAGPEFVIGIRLGAFEPTLADGIAHAKAMEAAGIEFLDISYGFGGHMDTTAPGNEKFPDVLRAAGAIKAAVSVPVFGVQNIRTPEMAAEIVETLGLDLVDIGRSALVDPNWPKKALSGQVPGKCLGCKVCQWRIDPSKCPGRKRIATPVTSVTGSQ